MKDNGGQTSVCAAQEESLGRRNELLESLRNTDDFPNTMILLANIPAEKSSLLPVSLPDKKNRPSFDGRFES